MAGGAWSSGARVIGASFNSRRGRGLKRNGREFAPERRLTSTLCDVISTARLAVAAPHEQIPRGAGQGAGNGSETQQVMPALPVDYLISALVTMFVVVDPIGLVPTFVAITHGLPLPARRQIATRASLIAAAILIGGAVIGEWLLTRLGISLPAFRIAGGLLLFSIASEMVFGLRIERQSRTAEQALEDVRHMAAFPLAIPLMAGPGAITATVLLAAQAGGRPVFILVLVGVILVVIGLCLAMFLFASRIGPLLGITANVVLSRLLGVLLAALAVQFVIDGIRAVLSG
jgi:multiple antibiotic resistance protein